MGEINTNNDQLVGVTGDFLVILNPTSKMTRPQAIRHAAWLVALADDDRPLGEPSFAEVLEAVRGL